MKEVRVGPTGKRTFFLDIPEHYSGFVFNMESLKIEGEGPCVHFQFHSTAGADIPLFGDQSVFFPGGKKSLKSTLPAVICIEIVC